MAIQERDIRDMIKGSDRPIGALAQQIARRSLVRIDNDPKQVEMDLFAAREDYIELAGYEPPATRAFSPLRAAASYLEFKCRRGFEKAASKSGGEAAEYLSGFSEGMGEIAWALITAEDAVALGVSTQTNREVEEYLRFVPSDDKAFYSRDYARFAKMLIKRRMKRLLRDYSGKTVVEEEFKDMRMIFEGNTPYTIRPPFEEESRWSGANIKGASFAVEVYSKVFDIAQPIFHGSEINVNGIRVLKPGEIKAVR